MADEIDDLGSELEKVRDEVMAKHEPDVIEEKPERLRDVQGRFAKAEAESIETAVPVKAETPAEPSPAAPIADPAPTEIPKPPKGLNEAIKARWAQIDPELRAEIERRENDFVKGASKFDEDRNYARSVRQLIEPYAQMFQNAGLDQMSGLRALLNAQATFDRGTQEQKTQLIAQLARQYNIDLGQVQAVPTPDPQFLQVQNELNQLRNQLATQTAQVESAKQAEMRAELDTFKETHEHFDAVSESMAGLLNSGLAKTLQEAYDKATWMHPEIRSLIQSQDEAKRKAEEAKRVSDAKRKAVSLTGAPGLSKGATAIPERSLDEEIEANFKAAMGRI